MTNINNPRVEIEYCPGCRWLLRAGWMAQELLSTFEGQLGEVALIPSKVPGAYQIRFDGELLWCRKRNGGFPEVKTLKQLVRDKLDPEMNLGHLDRE